MIGVHDKDELKFLSNIAKSVWSIADVGCWKGLGSTKAFLDNCRGTVYAIDTFKGSPWPDPTRLFVKTGNIKKQFLANTAQYTNLELIESPSLEAVHLVPNVDITFLDASHEEEDLVEDIKAWREKTNYVLCGHDYRRIWWPGVWKAVDKLIPNVSYYKSIWYVLMGSYKWD